MDEEGERDVSTTPRCRPPPPRRCIDREEIWSVIRAAFHARDGRETIARAVRTVARRFLVGLALVGALAWLVGDDEPPVQVATFNIRFFPEPTTDLDAVAARMAEVDADVMAVQEIRDPEALGQVLRTASEATGRDLRASLGRYCRKSSLWLGIVYDHDRYRVVETRGHGELAPPGHDGCGDGYPPAFAAQLEDDEGSRVLAMSVHLKCCGSVTDHLRRRQQWAMLVASLPELERQLDGDLVIAGDFNTTGWHDDEWGERTFIESVVAASGLTLTTRDVGCTEYWEPKGPGRGFATSTLDHILTRAGEWEPAEAMGMCEHHACALGDPGSDYVSVSDHCPVRVVGEL